MKSGSVWAIADQMVASAGNFAITLLLARGLAPGEFGTFVLINSTCLIAFGFHANLIVSPLVVLGASASAAKSRTYPTVALMLTVALLPVSFLVVFSASMSLHREATGLLAVSYILAWQLQETTRRALISRLRYRDAIWGDAISYIGQALLVGLLFLQPRSTLNEAFAIMGATSLAAAALQCWQARPARATWTEFRTTGIAFWILGKWLIAAALIGMAAGPLFPWLLNWLHGREAVAAYQAVMNLLAVANPIILSIPAIVMPVAANFLLTHREHGARSLLGLGIRYVWQIELILAPALLLLAMWPHAALALFYGKASPYCDETLALRVGVVGCLLYIPLNVFTAALTGSGRTKRNAIAHGAGAVASLVCAPPLIFSGGVVGAMLAVAASRGASLLMATHYLWPSSPAGGGGGVTLECNTSAALDVSAKQVQTIASSSTSVTTG